MTLEEGLELINNYKKGLEKFLETLPEQSVQLGSEMIQTLTLNSKNQIANLEQISPVGTRNFETCLFKVSFLQFKSGNVLLSFPEIVF